MATRCADNPPVNPIDRPTPRQNFLHRLTQAQARGQWHRLVLSRPHAAAHGVLRTTVRPIVLKGQAMLSFVDSLATSDITKNWPAAEGLALVDELVRRARVQGFDTLSAFTHGPGYFMRMGFSLVPHHWMREKIAADCQSCALFRQCGQSAVVLKFVRITGPIQGNTAGGNVVLTGCQGELKVKTSGGGIDVTGGGGFLGRFVPTSK